MAPKAQVLSNAELIILEMIIEMEPISGYDLNKLIEERGIREWADIGTTAIYLGLKKLEKKKFVSWVLDTNKTGKGPLPRRFSVTNLGRKNLSNEILFSLSKSGARDRRFDLAFYGIGFLPRVVVMLALEKRVEQLALEYNNIDRIANLDYNKGLPLHKKSIIDHKVKLIENEIEFLNQLLEKLRNREIDI